MAISKELRERIKGMTAELRREMWGPSGAPPWGTNVCRDRRGDGRSRRCAGLRVAFRGAARASRSGRPCGGQVQRMRGADPPGRNCRHGSSRPNEEKPSGKNPTDAASDVGRLFFPQSQALGIAPDDTVSPRVLGKMVYAGTSGQ